MSAENAGEGLLTDDSRWPLAPFVPCLRRGCRYHEAIPPRPHCLEIEVMQQFKENRVLSTEQTSPGPGETAGETASRQERLQRQNRRFMLTLVGVAASVFVAMFLIVLAVHYVEVHHVFAPS
jgi:hypothetical protein